MREAKVYELFNNEYAGIPRIYGHGLDGDCYVMIMETLSSSLQDLLTESIFPLKAVLIVAVQALAHLEYIHSKSHIHGDLKPSNFLLGSSNKRNQVFIIDFGLAKQYRYPKTGKHIPLTEKNGFHGTPRYASVHTHEGIAPSRRDDVESLGYVLIYLLKGKLPWQAVPPSAKRETKKQKRKRIYEMKRNMPPEELCKDLPEEFALYMKISRSLRFKEAPDYEYLKNIFITLLHKLNLGSTEDDWVSHFNSVNTQENHMHINKITTEDAKKEKKPMEEEKQLIKGKEKIKDPSSEQREKKTLDNKKRITEPERRESHKRKTLEETEGKEKQKSKENKDKDYIPTKKKEYKR